MSNFEVSAENLQVSLVRTNSCPKRLTTADLMSTMPSAVQDRQVQDAIRTSQCSIVFFSVLLAGRREMQAIWVQDDSKAWEPYYKFVGVLQ